MENSGTLVFTSRYLPGVPLFLEIIVRARNIKPGFWENERIGNLSHSQRLLFIGLWCLADREGKLEDRPEKISHLIFGYDKKKIDINGELTVIERWGFIHRYKIASTPLIIVLNFKKHQSPHHTEKKSNLPDPESLPTIHGELTVSHGEYRSDSLNHESRIMNHESPQPSPNGDLFYRFWEVYPRKESKQAALKAWKKLSPDEDLFKKILDSIAIQKNGKQWMDGFVPHPSTWLNQRRWEDEIFETKKKELDPCDLRIIEHRKQLALNQK